MHCTYWIRKYKEYRKFIHFVLFCVTGILFCDVVGEWLSSLQWHRQWRIPNTFAVKYNGSYITVPKVTQFSCERLFSRSNGEFNASVSRAKQIMRHKKKEALNDIWYSSMTQDCDSFKKIRGYILDPMRQEEAQFPIAYSLVVFKDTEQIERLLRAIYRPQNVYCIHVDSKTQNKTFDAISSIVKCFENVFIASKRYDVRWGQLSVMLPDLLCMKQLLEHKTKWRYFINLAGQEFPLKTNGDLVKVMKALDGANDLECTIKRQNSERVKFSVNTRKKKPPPPHGIRITKGNMHMTASRGFIDFVINNQKSKDFYAWINDTRIPEEQYYSSIQHNPKLGAPGAYTGVNFESNKKTRPVISRFIVWAGDSSLFSGDCHGKFVRGVCVIGIGDLPDLVANRELFVNKLYLKYDYLALDCLEEWLFDQMRAEYNGERQFNVSFYEQLEYVKHKQ